MGAPIRAQVEIDQIINRSQHALADIGLEIVNEAKQGKTITDPDHRDKIYRLELLQIFLTHILDPEGNIILYYQAADNAKKFNKILDGLVNLAKSFDGPAIPFLGMRNLPLYFFPSTSSGSGGQQTQVTPGGTTFQNLAVDSPGEVIDAFDANISNFAYYIYSVAGQGAGEGNRSGFFITSWKGSTVTISGDAKGPDTGGSTVGVTFSAAIVSGQIQLTCNVPTDGWIVRGVRIVFQTISFLSQQGDFPNGIRTEPSGPFIKFAKVTIGEWDMDATGGVTVSHGLTAQQAATIKILAIQIFPDAFVAGTAHYQLDMFDIPSATIQGGVNQIGPDPGGIAVNRKAAGFFDSTLFNQVAGYNRGNIFFSYEI